MKSTKSILFALFLFVGQFTFQAYADAVKTVGTTGSDYTTLKLAFNAINSGELAGAVELQIVDNTTETASALLTGAGGVASVAIVSGGTGYGNTPTVTFTAPPTGGVLATATATAVGGIITSVTITNPGCGYTSAPTVSFNVGTGASTTVNLGTPAYTSLKIYPTVTGKTITGGNNKALILLSGVNNVTFDGRLNQTGIDRDLTIVNTTSGSGPMTFQLIGNASNNTFKYCKIKGLGQSSSSAMFTLSNPLAASATGCANNTISNNIFSGTSSAANTRPFAVIYSIGVTGALNTGNNLQNNDFQDCFVNNGNTSCVGLGNFNNTWNISGNSFYETVNYTNAVSNSTYNFIYIGSGNSHSISNNYIGGTATQCGGSVYTKINNNNNTFKGITFASNDAAGAASTIENNVIKNISWSNGTTTAPWTGISVENTHNVSINGNIIGGISVTNSAAGSDVIGINKTNGTTNQTISKNFIYGLTSSAATSGQLWGIKVSGGLSTISNNIVTISTNNAVSIIGIYDGGSAGKTVNWYFNTVRIGGAPISGTIGSYCFWSQALSNTRDFRNNIFVNTRSNSGATGSHYAAYFNYSANTNLTLSNNNYYISGTGGILGRYAGANVTTGTVIVTGKDVGSVSVDPGFANPTGTAAVDFKPSDASLTGVSGTGITTDYSDAARNIPTIGAWEVAISLDVPGAPTIGTALGGNAQASVAFTTPASNGGSAITGYTVTSLPGNITASGSSSPIVVTGLTNGTAYTFTVTATNAQGTGVASSPSNSVTPVAVPDAPTIGTATASNNQASVTFTAPSNIGDSPITGYTVTSSPGNITSTGASSPIIVTGLTNGTAYTFTVTATNTQGTGVPSAASNSVTPSTVPDAPTIGTAIRGNAQVSVAFTAPANNGGSPITGYTVTSSPDDITATGASSPIIVTGLTNGTAYTFTVTATNTAGTGTSSSASNSVTPISDVPVVSAPTPPERVAGDVLSVFSDAYTQIAGATVFNPNWGQTTTVSNISVAGNNTMKYSTLNYEGTNLGSDLNLSTLGMTHLHFDVWSPDETLIRFSLIQRTPQSEKAVNSTMSTGIWNSFDIPITDFTSQGLAVSSIYQLKIEGSGWYPTNTANRTTVFLDNIYFYIQGINTSIDKVDNIAEITCFPNPIMNHLVVNAASEISKITVRNLVGQTIKTIAVSGSHTIVDISQLAAGNYCVTVKLANGGTTTYKVVKL